MGGVRADGGALPPIGGAGRNLSPIGRNPTLPRGAGPIEHLCNLGQNGERAYCGPVGERSI
jgi:hypothetical protein